MFRWILILATAVGTLGCQPATAPPPVVVQDARLDEADHPEVVPAGVDESTDEALDDVESAQAIVDTSAAQRSALVAEIDAVQERIKDLPPDQRLGGDLRIGLLQQKLTAIDDDPAVARAKQVVEAAARRAEVTRRQEAEARNRALIAERTPGRKIIDYRVMAFDFMGPPDPIFENTPMAALPQKPEVQPAEDRPTRRQWPDKADARPRTQSRPSQSYTGGSSYCGATTRSGNPCRRLVAGGGYCYQHR